MHPYPNLPEALWLGQTDKFRSSAPLLYVAGLLAVLTLSVLLTHLSSPHSPDDGLISPTLASI